MRGLIQRPASLVRRLSRSGWAIALAAMVAVVSLLPPSHIHLAEHDHDHVAIEHAHWAAHGSPGVEVEEGDDDGLTLFVDHPAVVPQVLGHVEVPRPALVALLIVLRPGTLVAENHRGAGNAPRDGPARLAVVLRGPPFVL